MRHQEQQTDDIHPDMVRSEPVPVPPAGSGDRTDHDGRYDAGVDDDPDSPRHADDDPDTADAWDAHDDRTTVDARDDDNDPTTIDARDDDNDPTTIDARDDDDPERAGRPEFHDPAPVPSALGAPTVGGAVAAAALASDERGKPDPRADQTAAPGDGASDDATRDLSDDTAPVVDDRTDPLDADGRADDRTHEFDTDERATGTTAVGVARPVSEEEGILSAGEAGAHDAGERVDAYPVHPGQEDRDRVDADGPTGAADPDDVTDRHIDTDRGDTADGEDFGGTADDGALLPGAVPVDPVAALVPADAAQGFRDRWRDVQLRFVDDPRGAATEARDLVGDVVESLSTALTAQRDALNDWQDGEDGDTERLRVAVRRYRDLVDRMLSL